MAKKINYDKVLKEFEKGDTNEQIETYHALGEWIHDEIKAKEIEAQLLRDKLNQPQVKKTND